MENEETKETRDILEVLPENPPKGRVDREGEILNKKAGIFLSLSPYKEELDRPGKYYIDDTKPEPRAYFGLRTNDAPIQYLIDEVYRAGYNRLEVVCIQTPKTENTYNKLKNFIKGYMDFRNWDMDIEVKYVEYKSSEGEVSDDKGDDKLYYQFYKDLNDTVDGLDAFYVDYTGGLRDMSFLMVVAIRFLEFKGIECKKVIYSDFYPTPGQIKSLNSVYKLFQVINGMNEFVSSGTTRQLDDMFEKENPLVKVIHEFSHATSVGDMAAFDERLKELKDVLNKEEDSNDLNSLMISSMRDVIKKKIFGDGQEIDYFRLIDWCIENKMYQQAATLYIEKVPIVYFEEGGILTDVIELSDKRNLGSSPQANTFYTDLPKWLSHWEDFCKILDSIEIPGGEESYSAERLKRRLKQIYKNYPDAYKRFEIIIDNCFNKYKNTNKKFVIVGDGADGLKIEANNIDSFLTHLKEQPKGDINYYLFWGEQKPKKGGEKDSVEDLKQKFMYIKKAYTYAQDNPYTNDDKSICVLMTFYLAIKMLRNKMSHAVDSISNLEEPLKEEIKELIKEATKANIEVTVSLDESDIKKLLTQAMLYTKRDWHFMSKKKELEIVKAKAQEEVAALENLVKKIPIQKKNLFNISKKLEYYAQIIIYLLCKEMNGAARFSDLKAKAKELQLQLPEKRELTPDGKDNGLKLLKKYFTDSIEFIGEGEDTILRWIDKELQFDEV